MATNPRPPMLEVPILQNCDEISHVIPDMDEFSADVIGNVLGIVTLSVGGHLPNPTLLDVIGNVPGIVTLSAGVHLANPSLLEKAINSIQDKEGTLLRDSNKVDDKNVADVLVLPHLVMEEINIATPCSVLEVHSAAGVKGIAITSMTTDVNSGMAPHFGLKSVYNQAPSVQWCFIQKAMLLHLEFKGDQNVVPHFSVLSSRSTVNTRGLPMCLIPRTKYTIKSPVVLTSHTMPAIPRSRVARAHTFYAF